MRQGIEIEVIYSELIRVELFFELFFELIRVELFFECSYVDCFAIIDLVDDG